MNHAELIFEQLNDQLADIQQKLRMVEYELRLTDHLQKSIIIKTVGKKQYYYEQWRENGKLKSKYLSPVFPGAVNEQEEKILHIQELKKEKRQLELMEKPLKNTIDKLKQDFRLQPLLPDYIFEVYWKDEISARVYVRGKRVTVSRFTDHPAHQLFAEPQISRAQLDRILELRCWERNRADIQEILALLGLETYVPLEIIKKTHGVSANDYLWIRFAGENLTSKDVLVR